MAEVSEKRNIGMDPLKTVKMEFLSFFCHLPLHLYPAQAAAK